MALGGPGSVATADNERRPPSIGPLEPLPPEDPLPPDELLPLEDELALPLEPLLLPLDEAWVLDALPLMEELAVTVPVEPLVPLLVLVEELAPPVEPLLPDELPLPLELAPLEEPLEPLLEALVLPPSGPPGVLPQAMRPAAATRAARREWEIMGCPRRRKEGVL
jgi:hypothetical protein